MEKTPLYQRLENQEATVTIREVEQVVSELLGEMLWASRAPSHTSAGFVGALGEQFRQGSYHGASQAALRLLETLKKKAQQRKGQKPQPSTIKKESGK